MRVYVAGPLTRGNYWDNVGKAEAAGIRLMDAGHTPFLPHLYAYLALREDATGISYEDWMAQDFAWLEQCDALLRLPGESPGSEREVQKAREMGIPVHHDIEALL